MDKFIRNKIVKTLKRKAPDTSPEKDIPCTPKKVAKSQKMNVSSGESEKEPTYQS